MLESFEPLLGERFHRKLHRELEQIVDLDFLHGVEIEFESLQVNHQAGEKQTAKQQNSKKQILFFLTAERKKR